MGNWLLSKYALTTFIGICSKADVRPWSFWIVPARGRRAATDGGDDEDSDTDEDSDEPALGSLDGQGDQTRWADGGCRDLEVDGAESGIADLDGLLEQIGSPDWQAGRDGLIIGA